MNCPSPPRPAHHQPGVDRGRVRPVVDPHAHVHGQGRVPLASPTGAEWLNEMQPYPMASLNDDTYTVAVAKLGTMVLLSEESVYDTAFPIADQVANMLRGHGNVQVGHRPSQR